MDTLRALLLLFLTLSSTAASGSAASVLRLPSDECDESSDLYCDSWRVSVEANNAQNWFLSKCCAAFVGQYMSGKRYASDLEVVAAEALAFAKTVMVDRAGKKDVWVFDIDETLLSNLGYYAKHGYGSGDFDRDAWNSWVNSGDAPALSASLNLYNELALLGFRMVLITGRRETRRSSTTKNLWSAGYGNWERLILRQDSDNGKAIGVYKSERREKLVADGYKIHGNSGDQWSDLLGPAMAKRSFKLSNPMYYIG